MLCVPGRPHSTCSTPTTMARGASGRRRLHREDLEDVAFLDVAEPLQPDAALEPFGDLADVFLEPAQRRDNALVHDDAVPDHPHFGAAGHAAGGHVTARDRPD